MRKGFILTLTALATTLLVTSAVALGPVVSGIPDVYIGPEGVPAEQPGTLNTFRYSQALTLWAYVTPGVTTGDGSDSDTLYQAWAIKDATLSGPTGSYLAAGSGVHYSIIQGNAVDALFLTPTLQAKVPGTAWAAEINTALNGTGTGLIDYSLENAGLLTFRNVRLSPLPEQATYPPPGATGVLDVQEATLYVSDTNTTPGADEVLLVTVDAGTDSLSGGLKWEMVNDYTASTAAFVAFKFKSDGPTFDGNPTDLTMTNTNTALRIQTPLTNAPTTAYYYYGEFGAPVAGLDPANLYRLKTSLTAPGGAANASIILSFNARGTAGYGFVQTNSGAAGGPTATASTWSAFMAPLEAGSAQAQFIVFDSSAAGGVIEASAIQVQRIALADVLASASVVKPTVATFPVAASGNASATEWGYFQVPFTTLPTFTRTPANGAAGALVMGAITASGQTGMASFQGPTASIATTPGKLVFVRAKLSTSSTISALLPTLWLNTEAATIQGGALIERDDTSVLTAAATGPTVTPKDYYLVFEAKDAVCTLNVRTLSQVDGINGNVQMTELEVLEADMPLEP